MIPTIRITFLLSGQNVPFDDITTLLGIAPSATRKKETWPLPSIRAGLAEDLWMIDIPHTESWSLSQQFHALQDILSGKENTIIALCQRYCLTANIEVSARWECGLHPALVLEENQIHFLSKINASIGIDPYVDMKLD